jgi:hypothetical protein
MRLIRDALLNRLAEEVSVTSQTRAPSVADGTCAAAGRK